MEIRDLGLIDYRDAYKIQESLRDDVIAGASEKIILCSHHPIVTLGRQSSEGDISGWQGDTQKVSRGGKATYHGPGQVIIYPIIDLTKRNNDIHKYVRDLEQACVTTLLQLGINAIGNPDKTSKTTGVWVGDKKVASIGVAVKRWVTYHGIAMNVKYDPLAFVGINPCGFSTEVMTSIEELLGQQIECQQRFADNLLSLLNR